MAGIGILLEPNSISFLSTPVWLNKFSILNNALQQWLERVEPHCILMTDSMALSYKKFGMLSKHVVWD